jgi:hypothetical protein
MTVPAEVVDISPVDLLLDKRNARLREAQDSEPATVLSIVKQQKRQFLNLANDIVEKGLDPLNVFAVVPTADQRLGTWSWKGTGGWRL